MTKILNYPGDVSVSILGQVKGTPGHYMTAYRADWVLDENGERTEVEFRDGILCSICGLAMDEASCDPRAIENGVRHGLLFRHADCQPKETP